MKNAVKMTLFFSVISAMVFSPFRLKADDEVVNRFAEAMENLSYDDLREISYYASKKAREIEHEKRAERAAKRGRPNRIYSSEDKDVVTVRDGVRVECITEGMLVESAASAERDFCNTHRTIASCTINFIDKTAIYTFKDGQKKEVVYASTQRIRTNNKNVNR